MMPAASSFITVADRDPRTYYEDLRRRGRVVWDEQMGVWLLSDYQLVRELMDKEHVIWRSTLVPAEEPRIAPALLQMWKEWIGSDYRLNSLEGKAQRRVHRWWMEAFSPKILDAWNRQVIEPVVDAQIDRFAAAGRAELVADYAHRCSPRVILAIMGLPWEDEEFIDRVFELAEDHDAVFEYFNQQHTSPPVEVLERGAFATQEMQRMFMSAVRERRAGEGDDFISLIWRGADELFGGAEFTEDDVANQAMQAFIAGGETTSDLIANGLYLILAHPELQASIREGRVVGDVVEEALRLHSVVAFLARTALQDTELGGQRIERGQTVVGILDAAGKDPGRYPDPFEPRLGRDKPADHFAFGKGPRRCPGRALVRRELETIYSRLLDRVDDLRLDPEAEPPRYSGFFLREWKPLHVRFEQS